MDLGTPAKAATSRLPKPSLLDYCPLAQRMLRCGRGGRRTSWATCYRSCPRFMLRPSYEPKLPPFCRGCCCAGGGRRSSWRICWQNWTMVRPRCRLDPRSLCSTAGRPRTSWVRSQPLFLRLLEPGRAGPGPSAPPPGFWIPLFNIPRPTTHIMGAQMDCRITAPNSQPTIHVWLNPGCAE